MRSARLYSSGMVLAVLASSGAFPAAADPVSVTLSPVSRVSRDTAGTERTAMATARRTGMRVELSEARTTTRRIFVNPDGTKTLEQNATPSAVLPGGMIRWLHVHNHMGAVQNGWGHDTAQGAKVGHVWGDPTYVYRSLFLLNTTGVGGSRIIKATFRITLDHSPTGSATPVDLWHLRDLDPAAVTNWSTTSGHWLRKLATASGNAWTGHQPDMPMEFTTTELREVVEAVAAGNRASVSLGLRAPDENNQSQWKKFFPGTAVLAITYNNAPRRPDQVNFTRPLPCGSATKPVAINTSQPSLAAVASDPDNDLLTTRLSIHRASDGGLEYQSDVGPTSSGSAFAWPQVPAGELVNGGSYYYRASSNDNVPDDGIDFGEASPACYFTVDTAPPSVPVLDSADYPDGEPVILARTAGTVTFRPGSTSDTDIAEYTYGFHQDLLTSRIKARPDGTAIAALTVWPDPNNGIPSKRLYVKAVDNAGNLSQRTQAWDLAALDNPNPVPHVRGDVNGDGRADVTAVLDHGFGRSAVWNLNARSGGFHAGAVAWDTGEQGGFPLYRTRPVHGDFDGDGRGDVALFREEAGRRITLYQLRSDGDSFQITGTPVWNSGTGQWPLTTARMVSGDVNGDRKIDIAVQLNNGNGTWRALVFLGGNLGAPVQWSQVTGEWAQSAPLLADVNGDGRDDLVNMRNLGGCRTVTEVHSSSGGGFASSPVGLHDSGAGNYCWERSKPVVGDVDGDGKDDIIAMYEYGQTDAGFWVFRSTGTSMVSALWWRTPGQFDPARLALSVGDFGLDNRDDIAVVHALDGGGRELWTLPSTGSSFGARVLGWQEPKVGATTGPKFEIESRTYELVARHSGRCLEVANASQADPAALRQWACNGGLHQRFRLVRVAGTDQFMAQPAHRDGHERDSSPRCLDVSNQSHQDGVSVAQWKCLGQANQQMTLEYLEGSSYDTVFQLRFAHSGKCGNVQGGGLGDGALLEQQSCAAVASQQWILRAALNSPQLNARYRISSVNGGKVVDVTNCQTDDGADMRMWNWIATSECQRWHIQPVGDDVYRIVDNKSGKAIDVQSCSTADLAPLVLWRVNDSDCQRWRIEPAYGGSWSIHQAKTGKSVDAAGCSAAAGADLIIWPYWNGPCQRWILDPM